MNKYRDKSDFEINKAVAEKVGIIRHLYLAEFLGEVIWDVTSNDNYNGFISKKGLAFDPCNNPADAMPIIIENKITVAYDKLYETWCAHVGSVMGDGDWDYSIEPAINYCDDNYYRAAMICFLMMKDAENEKV
ncbi:phage protein NinX family protein [Morganella morganii]|uniref:phage protein NinX family protein n=1 Tax=Morganella morganii TaxID=582 RepID=UPI0032DB80D4